MAQRKRHHFVPRFLLSRFASRKAGKKSWIWQLSKDNKPVEISTRDAAVAENFHGDSSTGVEDALGDAETRFSRALVAIDRGEAAQDHAKTLREFVWYSAVRTRALRNQFGTVADQLVAKIIEELRSDNVKNAVAKSILSDFDHFMESGLSSLSVMDQAAARSALTDPLIRGTMLHETEETVRSFPDFFSEMLLATRPKNLMQDAAERGHIQGLSQLLTEDQIPENFTPYNWEIRQTTPLILADACVAAVTRDGKIGSVLHSSQPWHTIYLPISSSQVLVASREAEATCLLLSGDEINRASAELSWSHFYCSEVTDSIRSLTSDIGKADSLVSGQELANIFSNSNIAGKIVEGLRGDTTDSRSKIHKH